MKAKILKYLGHTPQIYETQFYELWLRWAINLSHNDQTLQMVLANAAIFNYYQTELYKCEDEFLRLISRYEGISHRDASNLYAKCTYALFSRHPKGLIEAARKIQIIN